MWTRQWRPPSAETGRGTGRTSAGQTAIVCLAAMLLPVSPSQTTTSDAPRSDPRNDPCKYEAPALVGGLPPLSLPGNLLLPQKVRDVRPQYPELPADTILSRTLWIGQVLLDATGKVVHVWTVRELELPAINTSITEAVQQWTYTPVTVNGDATPTCMTVRVTFLPR
jgi:hypothetical protein